MASKTSSCQTMGHCRPLAPSIGISWVLASTTSSFGQQRTGRVDGSVSQGGAGTVGSGDWHEWVAEYLLVQHITPHAATGQSPVELLMSCCLWSPLDQLYLDFAVAKPLGCSDSPLSFVPGDRMFVRNYVEEVSWVPTLVVGVSSPRFYQVALEDVQL